MRYSINIESARCNNVFRYNANLEWVRCANTSRLNNNDHFSINPTEIIDLQIRDVKQMIEGNEFEIEPDMGTEFGNENQLHYQIYGFRQNYPIPPNENQLMDLLLNGNDEIRNILVLKTDGLFYLLTQSEILPYTNNPDYVLQFEGFQPNNGYVGATINNSLIRNYVQNIFKASVVHWIEHLRLKQLHDFADIELENIDHIPDILVLFDKLREIENAWIPDY